MVACAQQLEPYLSNGGRSFVQGALGWIWARSPLTIPVPGFRTMEQVRELALAREYGPLPQDVMQGIEELVSRIGVPGRA